MTKAKLLKETKSWLLIAAGCLVYALALNCFLNGNRIAAGGLGGIATVVTYVAPVSMSTVITIINIPLLILSFFLKGWKFTRNTLIGSIFYTLCIQLTSGLPTLTMNPLVASVFGGFLYGLGVALLAMGNGSVGGTDLIIRLLAGKLRGFSLGKIGMCVDGGVVIFAIIVFRDIEVGLYAILTIYVYTLFADKIMLGFDRASLCLIVTAQDPTAIANSLMEKMKRSVTKLDGVGMYSGGGRAVLMTVVRPSETPKVKDAVYSHDPDAFVVVASANEVLGGNFKSFLPPAPKVG